MMKKLILILFMLPIFATAQLEFSDNFAFAKDKKDHLKTASAIEALIYGFTYKKTKDARGSFRAACIFSQAPIWGKEVIDVLMGGEFSFSDIVYGEAGVFFTGAVLYGATRLLEKRKAKKIKEKYDIVDNIHYSLDNPIFAGNDN